MSGVRPGRKKEVKQRKSSSILFESATAKKFLVWRAVFGEGYAEGMSYVEVILAGQTLYPDLNHLCPHVGGFLCSTFVVFWQLGGS